MKTVTPGNEYDMAGVRFLAVPAYFAGGKSHPKENGWVGYVLKINGASYYVTGDSGPVPETEKIEADVIFPLLWGCGGNVDQAVKMVELSKAGLIVPVHHGGHMEAAQSVRDAQAPAAGETFARQRHGQLGAPLAAGVGVGDVERLAVGRA